MEYSLNSYPIGLKLLSQLSYADMQKLCSSTPSYISTCKEYPELQRRIEYAKKKAKNVISKLQTREFISLYPEYTDEKFIVYHDIILLLMGNLEGDEVIYEDYF